MRSMNIIAVAALLAGGLAMGCGYPKGGLLANNLIDGSEASSRINEAGLLGAIICAARTGRPARLEFTVRTDQIYGIEADRAYKESDVNACADNIKLTTSLSDDCTPANTAAVLFPTCVLKPVDKITGGG